MPHATEGRQRWKLYPDSAPSPEELALIAEIRSANLLERATPTNRLLDVRLAAAIVGDRTVESNRSLTDGFGVSSAPTLAREKHRPRPVIRSSTGRTLAAAATRSTAVALGLIAFFALAHDGWSKSAAGCVESWKLPSKVGRSIAQRCAQVARRTSRIDAALSAAYIYASLDEPEEVRVALEPFEGAGDPSVLGMLARANHRLGNVGSARRQYEEAYRLSRGVVEPRVRARAAYDYAYSLMEDLRYQDALRVCDELLGSDVNALSLGGQKYLSLIRDEAMEILGIVPPAGADGG
jgi:tetratricopeptide (TPR) repeat protein